MMRLTARDPYSLILLNEIVDYIISGWHFLFALLWTNPRLQYTDTKNVIS